MNRLTDRLCQKIETGIRLSRKDALTLLTRMDTAATGRQADALNVRKNGRTVFFNVNCHINLTNICTARCDFCAFSCSARSKRAYVMPVETAVDVVLSCMPAGITELHMVSGLHPTLPFQYYLDVVETIKHRFPLLHIKAFTPVEIAYFSKISGFSVQKVLMLLKAAGLGSMPGGGAEILSARVRKQLCPEKADASQWLHIMKQAHNMGIKSNATMLYGHIETPEEIVDHLLKIRKLQDETGGFQAFIPLPFHPCNTKLKHLARPTACEQLKMISISRILLDNIDNIKTYWIMSGLKTAQMSLFYGANDIDGTVMNEKITHAAGASTEKGVTVEQLITLIKDAGAVPVQRDSVYHIRKTYG